MHDIVRLLSETLQSVLPRPFDIEDDLADLDGWRHVYGRGVFLPKDQITKDLLPQVEKALQDGKLAARWGKFENYDILVIVSELPRKQGANPFYLFLKDRLVQEENAALMRLQDNSDWWYHSKGFAYLATVKIPTEELIAINNSNHYARQEKLQGWDHIKIRCDELDVGKEIKQRLYKMEQDAIVTLNRNVHDAGKELQGWQCCENRMFLPLHRLSQQQRKAVSHSQQNAHLYEGEPNEHYPLGEGLYVHDARLVQDIIETHRLHKEYNKTTGAKFPTRWGGGVHL